MRRSMLFIPGNTPSLIMNGEILGADSIILDLEDAVSPAEKDSARILVRNTLKHLGLKGCEIVIRINPVDTDFWFKDLDEIVPEVGKQALFRRLCRCIGDVFFQGGYLAGGDLCWKQSFKLL